MRSFLLFFIATAAIGFGAGVATTSAAQSAADRIVDDRVAQYCAAGLSEFCK